MFEYYLYLSICVGLIQVSEGVLLWKANGVHSQNPMVSHCTTIEFVWFFVSLGAVFGLDLTPKQTAIPLLYMAYNVLGWIIAIPLVVKEMKAGSDLNQFAIPKWAVSGGIFFGAVFALISLMVSLKVLVL
ncbi:hypothetical protein [Pleionea sp. CnH1-48]|uniref:hypothetical protein n=1 Tax=Pleionea sp. CnH1-48 TaxID=2954494 RepID=UPI0020974FFF|nr:hypothetical protein [Pleionea sp. CnH1-48]MCO7223026.1 hypothetical protein [Pleionea sp. CnH1-48]